MDNMNQDRPRGYEYVEKLGLECMNNAVQRTAVSLIPVENDEEIINTVLRYASAYTRQFGKKYRLATFILKRNDTGYLVFNDDGGFSVAGPVLLMEMQEFVKLNHDAADYMLFAEVGDNLYTVVTN